MTTVIQVEGLGKQYRRGVRVDTGLRHALERFVRSPLKAMRGADVETFWALRDVSLEVAQGEVLGLIGRNGAGKTTLLKILSRITRPTEGWAEIRGHVGSLLEVGKGFHPELTGRENTFLSGAILGMSRAEITRKFDEIVAFAELEKFIDTPVKHYSSGMYVRLAFAVAAHLEPEILLVDEVLAVGDINFQKKCLGKMGEVTKTGRTVVFVSHQMNQIRRLCGRVAWVDGGSIRQSGPTHEVVAAYESAMAGSRKNGNKDTRGAAVQFRDWRLTGPDGRSVHVLETSGRFTIVFTATVNRRVELGHHGIALFNSARQIVWANSQDGLELEAGEYEFGYDFPSLPISPGSYTWRVSLYDSDDCLDAWDCSPDMIVATEPLGHASDEWTAVLNVPAGFQLKRRVPELSE